jgi:hypothetical protein
MPSAGRKAQTPKPTATNADEMIGLFGSRELESAAAVIAKRAEELGTFEFDLFDAMFTKDIEKEGYKELQRLGWTKFFTARGTVRVTDGFIKRVTGTEETDEE